MDRINKQKLVTNYSELFANHESIFIVKNLGLSVLEAKFIRSQLKKSNAKFVVTKNSLAKIALSKTKFSGIQELFNGPLATTYSNDPVSTSKLLIKLCLTHNKIEVVGGAIPGKHLSKDDVISLSKMLTQDENRARIIGLVNAASSKIIGLLTEPAAKIARALKSHVKKQSNL